MSFADELRSMQSKSGDYKVERWRSYCRNLGKTLTENITSTCRKAAREGESYAVVKAYARVDPSIMYGNADLILKEEAWPLIKEECEKLGLKCSKLSSRYSKNDWGPDSYTISCKVKW